MPTLELTDREAAVVLRMRMTPAEQKAAAQADADALRQRSIDRMTPAQKAAYLAEQERRAALTKEQLQAESLVAQKARIEEQLAKPDIAILVNDLVDGKVTPVKE